MNTRILIVDDQKFALQMLRDILAPLGYLIEEAEDGMAAFVKAKEWKPDLILMDLLMPGTNGIESSRMLKSHPQTCSVPILVITASKDRNNLLAAFEAGVDDYITKPFSGNALLARIQANLYKRDALGLLEQKKTDAKTLLDLSMAIASTLNSREILQVIVAKIADYINVKRCSLIKITSQTEGVLVAASDDPSAKGVCIDLSRYPELREMIRTTEPVVLKNVKDHPLLAEVRDLLARKDFHTIVVTPVRQGSKVLGALVLRISDQKRSLSSRELAFCQAVADVSANAIRNASMFEKAVEETDELRVIKERLEKELKQKTVYESLFEHVSEGLMVLNAGGQPQYVNRSAGDILGYSSTELMKMSLKDFLAEESLEVGMENHINFFLGRDFCRKYHVLFKTSSGEKRCVSISVSDHRLEGNNAILSFRDVTEEKRDRHLLAEANERLKALDLLKSEFIYTATNDLRLPVAVLHSHCVQLRDSDTESFSAMQREHLDSAVESCDRLMDLIEELLDSSRMEFSDFELTIEQKNIMDPIREVYTVLAPFATGKGLEMSVKSAGTDIPAQFDSKKIQCVLTNLIGNAVKFTPSGGIIRICVDADDSELRVSVSDTGEGIPKNHITSIFNEFYHLNSTGAAGKRGSGLGLAISKRIVDAHNGRLWVESSTDEGSTFTFCLPLSR